MGEPSSTDGVSVRVPRLVGRQSNGEVVVLRESAQYPPLLRGGQGAVGALETNQVRLLACLIRNSGGGAEALSVRTFRAAQR